MQLITPLSPDSCSPHIGRHFCIVLHDGTKMYGRLSGVSEKGLEFNGPIYDATVKSSHSVKANKSSKPAKVKGQGKAKTSAFGYPAPPPPPPPPRPYPPYPPGYGYGYGYGYGRPYALNWATIALLFLLPFV